MTPELMAIALIAGHCLADYPLQGDFLSKAKNRTAPFPASRGNRPLALTLSSTVHSWRC